MTMDMRTRVLIDMTIGALGAETAIVAATKIDTSRLMGCRPEKINHAIEFRGKTTLEGPLVYGLCEGLSAAEIAEWWTSDPQHDDDPEAVEQSMRHAFLLGYFSFGGTASETGDRFMRRARWPGWDVIEGEFVTFFVLNIGLAALTAGTLVDGFLEMLGDWIDK